MSRREGIMEESSVGYSVVLGQGGLSFECGWVVIFLNRQNIKVWICYEIGKTFITSKL